MSASGIVHKVVWITGAAGGLGQALVAAFAAGGWRVAPGWHRTPFPAAVTKDLFPIQCDATNRAKVAAALEQIVARWDRLDVLVNNAGATADRSLLQMTEEAWQLSTAVNLKAAFLCSQAALRPMLRQRDGQIINISSFSGRAGARGQTNYAAAKAGLLGLTQSLAAELGSSNVRVNAVLPGVMSTPMTARLGARAMAAFAAANVLGRINSIAEVAQFVVFLASTRNISGQLFQLDSRLARWT